MIQEQVFGAACANNPHSMTDNPTQAGAYHDGFEQGAKWYQNHVEEAFKQWLSEHIAFTADEENRTILQDLWEKINV